ncbi:hypothetical protein Holit_02585 [Hollandina sp. SP2]
MRLFQKPLEGWFPLVIGSFFLYLDPFTDDLFHVGVLPVEQVVVRVIDSVEGGASAAPW